MWVQPPTLLPNIELTQVACGDHRTIGLTKDGRMYVWGNNRYGQLGLGNLSVNKTPILNPNISFKFSRTKSARN